MEPRASSVDHEREPSRRTKSQEVEPLRPLQNSGWGGEPYEKELGEISPEISRTAVGGGLVPPPRDVMVEPKQAVADEDTASEMRPLPEHSDSKGPAAEVQMPIKEPLSSSREQNMSLLEQDAEDTVTANMAPAIVQEKPSDAKTSTADEASSLTEMKPALVPDESHTVVAPSPVPISPMACPTALDPPNESKEVSTMTTNASERADSPKPTVQTLDPGSSALPAPQTNIEVSTDSSIAEKPFIDADEAVQAQTIPLSDTTSTRQGVTTLEHTDADSSAAPPGTNTPASPLEEIPRQETAQIKPSSGITLQTSRIPVVAANPDMEEDVVMENVAVNGSPSVPDIAIEPLTATSTVPAKGKSATDTPMDVDASTGATQVTTAPSQENIPGDVSSQPIMDEMTGDVDMDPADTTDISVIRPDGVSPRLVPQEQGSSPGKDTEETQPAPTDEEIRAETGSVPDLPSTHMHSVVDKMLHPDPDSSDLTSLPSYDTFESSRRTDSDAVVSERQPQTQLPSADGSAENVHVLHRRDQDVETVAPSGRQDVEKGPVTVDSAALVPSGESDQGDQAEAGPSHPSQQTSVNAVLVNDEPISGTPSIATNPAAVLSESAAHVPVRPESPDDVEIPQAKEPENDIRESPTPPSVAPRPIPKPVDPRVLQRMLERQIVMGRQAIMSHAKEKQRELEEKVNQLKSQYRKLDKQWESHKTRIIAENEELARQLEAAPNPSTVQDPKPGGRKTRRGFVEQDHELMGFRDGDDEALAKALKAIEEMMESDPTQRALKTEATIPDMELDPDIWRVAYDDENSLVADPLAFYGHGVGETPGEWTEEEERKFRKLYASYPKQFGEIARGLPNKTTAQCVKHYYLTKKKRPFKEGANRNGQRQAAGGQAARMVAPVTREKVELAGVLATGDRAQAKQVADDIRPQGDRKAGKRKADEAEKSGDQGSKEGQKAKRKSGNKKRMVDIATAGDRAANGEVVAKKRKTLKKPSRLDLKERGQSASNRSSVSPDWPVIVYNADRPFTTVLSRPFHRSTYIGNSSFQRPSARHLYARPFRPTP